MSLRGVVDGSYFSTLAPVGDAFSPTPPVPVRKKIGKVKADEQASVTVIEPLETSRKFSQVE